MKITKINQFTPLHNIVNNKRQNNQNAQNPITQNSTTRPVFAYQDFNISFSGRTPEDFYAQDFNRNNMPSSMKEYLDYDYETRQHIPPEQMMGEVFKYLNLADNFEDVKSVYPNEELFQNLHENKSRNISSILYEIKTAKEMSDEPLFKDGSDNFGMYLLKKIYTEGKTVKEINKDFYEKDMNDTYKGIITKPIKDNITASYGIKFPTQAFWNSFIATREEYRKFFVTLPKNTTNPAVHLPKTATTDKAEETKATAPKKRAPRKYNIKDYQKKQLTNDIKSSSMSKAEVERKVRKRFGKDDPQASFIVKYLSPIMTVAADRAHLSEDLKSFTEAERYEGKKSNDEFMLQRYWNQNPIMKDIYSHAIIDTIDMFEDIYGEGGNIPINTDLKEVTPETKNNKVIDRVTPEYLELLDYTQTIFPERESRYEKHAQEQIKWENYFDEKYDQEKVQNIKQADETKEIDDDKLSLDDIDEKFKQQIFKEAKWLPSSLTSKYINFVTNEADLTYKIKVSQLPPDCTLEELEKIGESDGSPNYFDDLSQRFFSGMEGEYMSATCAINDLATRHKHPDAKKIELNVDATENSNDIDASFMKILKDNKKEYDDLYNYYNKPLTDKDRNLIGLAMMNEIDHFKPDENLSANTNAILMMLKEESKLHPVQRNKIRRFIAGSMPECAKSILNKDFSKEDKYDRFCYLIPGFIDYCIIKENYLQLLVNKEVIDKYKSNMDFEGLNYIRQMEMNLSPAEKEFYNASNEDIKAGKMDRLIDMPIYNKNQLINDYRNKK